MAVLERSASKPKVESLLRCQEISDATAFRHGKRNFRRRGQWTTFRDGGMRHQGSRRKTVTPYQYFEEMSPLFCATDVSFEIIGDHIQEHVRRFELSKKNRRLFVGGMRARQMLIATPLLKWYLEHGMVMAKIYQVAEFMSHRYFRDFVREVSDNR